MQLSLLATVMVLSLIGSIAQPAPTLRTSRELKVIETASVRVAVDLAGGAIADFRLSGSDLNPLTWGTPGQGNTNPTAYAHFLCLDRWGPPSEAEGKLGMPFHGEASSVLWRIENSTPESRRSNEIQMQCKLPKAGLFVSRTVRVASNSAVFSVQERIKNENPLGRIFNLVQHPTIAPPFLDESTIVNCNAGRGFAQGGTLNSPEEPSASWPTALDKAGKSVDMRRLAGDPNPNVVSYIIEDKYGWVTAFNPGKGLLIGYLWRTSDYPWLNLWRDARSGKPTARGLEFGTTGLHQPFKVLATKGRIWDRQLFEYLDAGETTTKRYIAFQMKIPAQLNGIERIFVEEKRLLLQARVGANLQDFTVTLDGLDAP